MSSISGIRSPAPARPPCRAARAMGGAQVISTAAMTRRWARPMASSARRARRSSWYKGPPRTREKSAPSAASLVSGWGSVAADMAILPPPGAGGRAPQTYVPGASALAMGRFPHRVARLTGAAGRSLSLRLAGLFKAG